MSENSNEQLSVHVNVEISTEALQTIVANAKRIAPKAADGTYHVDTAAHVSVMITRFLAEKDFDSFVMDIKNYASG